MTWFSLQNVIQRKIHCACNRKSRSGVTQSDYFLSAKLESENAMLQKRLLFHEAHEPHISSWMICSSFSWQRSIAILWENKTPQIRHNRQSLPPGFMRRFDISRLPWNLWNVSLGNGSERLAQGAIVNTWWSIWVLFSQEYNARRNLRVKNFEANSFVWLKETKSQPNKKFVVAARLKIVMISLDMRNGFRRQLLINGLVPYIVFSPLAMTSILSASGGFIYQLDVVGIIILCSLKKSNRSSKPTLHMLLPARCSVSFGTFAQRCIWEFSTTIRQMSEMFQWPKCLNKKKQLR